MKKNILLLSLFFLLGIRCYAQSNENKETIITLSIPDFKDTIALVKLGFEKPMDLEIPMEFTSEATMKNGKFKTSFTLNKPTNISTIINDRGLFRFPLASALFEPGDSIHVNIPNSKKMGLKDVEISGRGAEKFKLLQKIWRPYFDLKHKSLDPLTEFFRSEDRRIKLLDSALSANKSMVSRDIYHILRSQSLSAHYISSMMELMTGRIDQDSVIKLYQEYIVNAKLVDVFSNPTVFNHLPFLHKELAYLATLDYGAKHKVSVDDISSADLDLFYSIISDFYKKHATIKNHILAEHLVFYLKSKGLNKESEKVVKRYLTDVPKGIFHDQVLKRYLTTKENNSIGKPFYNFSLEDEYGKIVKLSDFKDKVVFIDFYYTGCGACRLLVPTIKEMEEKYRDKNIVFLSVSIAKTKKEWERGRGVYSSPASIQLYTNGEGNSHPLIVHAGINSYPTLFIVDPKGLISCSNVSYKPNEMSLEIDKALKMQPRL